MASRLNVVKAILRKVIQDERYIWDNRGLKGFSQFVRVLKYNHGAGSYRFNSIRGKSRRAVPAHSAHKRLQDGSTLKEIVASLINRVHQGIVIDSYSYVDVLQVCFEQKDLEAVKQLHDCIRTSRLEENTYVVNNLLKCYIGCGRLQNAQEVFNSFLNRSIVSWNIMIGGYSENDQAEDAIEVYRQLRKEGGQPTATTYLNVLKACASPVALKWGKDIHAHVIHDGLQTDKLVGTALLRMYVKCGSVEDARKVFDRMEKRDVMTWNVMIDGLAQHGLGHEAFSLFLQMQKEGLSPNWFTYLSILNPCSSSSALEWVKEVHAHSMKAGLDVDLRVANALVDMYAKCGSVNFARMVFDRMKRRDVISWTMMIGGLAQHGLGHEAFSLFLQMQKEGFSPNPITYLSILNPCSSTGSLEWVKKVHVHAMKAGLDVDVRVGNALVHMYAKIGCIVDAKQVFYNILERDVVSWTVMIGGLAQHGLGREALKLFEEMKLIGVKPSELSLLAVLSACSHAGLVDEGRFQFMSMTRDYSIKPALKHYNCMVDILGRAGNFEEAMLFVFNMPMKPNKVTWMALLGACKMYNLLKLGELVANEYLKLEPMDPSPYVILSSMYASGDHWDQVSADAGKRNSQEPRAELD